MSRTLRRAIQYHESDDPNIVLTRRSLEVELAVAALEKGRSAGVAVIPAELVQAGRETMP